MTEKRKKEIEGKLKKICKQLEDIAVELNTYINVSAHPAKEDNEPFYCIDFIKGNKYADASSYSAIRTIDRLLNQWERGFEDDV